MTYTRADRWGNLAVQSSKPARILSGEIANNGYHTTQVAIGKKRQRFLTHRLVARAFVNGYAEGLTVNHINGIKTDNRSVNLEWVTLSDNTVKQWETGLVNLRGDNHPSKKIDSVVVNQIRVRTLAGERAVDLAQEFQISTSLVYKIREGSRWASV